MLVPWSTTYILTIIRSVELIVVVGKVKSVVTSTGIVGDTNPIAAWFVDIIVPYPVPLELANSIVTNVSVLSFVLFFLKCKWNLCVPSGITENPNCGVINCCTRTGVLPVVVLRIDCSAAPVGLVDNSLYVPIPLETDSLK